MITLKYLPLSTATCAAFRLREEEGETVQIALLQGIGEEFIVFSDYNENRLAGWRRPTDGPVEMLKRIRELPGFYVEYTENEEYPEAMSLALNTVVSYVEREIHANYN